MPESDRRCKRALLRCRVRGPQQPFGVPTAFYLFALPLGKTTEAADTVFFEADDESIAKVLCRLFEMEYGADGVKFTCKPAAEFPSEAHVLFEEALNWLQVYDEPDRHVYDPPPSEAMHLLAQYALRAKNWAEILKAKRGTGSVAKPAGDVTAGKFPTMAAEDQRNGGLNLLLLLAQAYYALLENTVSCSCHALDLELNDSYLWTVAQMTNLLTNNQELLDFTPKFEPIFPDLYPSTIKDSEWEDMVAPEAESFLSAVQKYVHRKGAYPPEERSPAWIFIELFRPAITMSIEQATAYHQRMNEYMQKRLRAVSPSAKMPSPAPTATSHAPASAVPINREVRAVHFEDFSGREFERLVLAYAMRDGWPDAEWLGDAGADGGRDIWGKDQSGKTSVLLCANYKNLTLAKVASDLKKLVAGGAKPDQVIVVGGGKVSATLREKIKAEAAGLGFGICGVWSGVELEERIRRKAEHLLERFCHGDPFPETRAELQKIAASEARAKPARSQKAATEYVEPDHLSDEAKRLLVEMSLAQDGGALRAKTHSGYGVTIDGREFVPDTMERRIEAKWERAFKELLDLDLIEATDAKGEILAITDAGYELADECGPMR
jgi:hypothetical protein